MNEVKDLKKQIDDAQMKLNMKIKQIADLRKEITDLNALISAIRGKINQIQSFETLEVSDHAIIRWLERFRGVDIEEIKNEILDETTVKLISALGVDGRYNKRVVKRGVIVTILP